MIPVRERPQPPGTEALWADSWYFDFGGPDGFGGFVRLALYPNLGVAWWWTYLVRPHGTLVAVRDHEVPLPRGRNNLEVRADGLWAELVCETPLEHWSIGLEAFGVAFDDRAEAWGSEWGDRVAVGLDLEWEALGPPLAGPAPGPPGGEGYVQPGRVVGTVLLTDERIGVDVVGLRARSWGESDWWTGSPAHWAAALRAGGRCVIFGEEAELVEVEPDPDGIPQRAAYRLDGERWEAMVLGTAPVLVTGPKSSARLARALCRFTGPGHEGIGWAEWRLRS